MVIVTGIATVIVGYLYDPARRYKLDARRSILKSKQNNLGILVCVNRDENVNPIISLLEVSNPTRSSPITAFVVQLMDLKGSVTAFLKPYHGQTDSIVTSSMHIINAFNQFQGRYVNNVVVQHLTTIAPCATMHDDICILALDKRAEILIVPFHKQMGVSSMEEASDLSIRALNINVIRKAPCSVKSSCSQMPNHRHSTSIFKWVIVSYCYAFLRRRRRQRSPRYSKPMAEHPNISLTVVLLRSYDSNEDETDINNQVMKELKPSTVSGKKILFREEIVKNGIGTIQVIQSLRGNYDLSIVGKHHDPDSLVIWGLTDWIEYLELGIIGDMLVYSNDHLSVLVVQE